MFNILSYAGMNLQSEVCLWTLLGLIRTIFDATLFKVNANLKQVWQMTMPPELPMPVQQVLRTMISGIMLVQCFTVYVFLASYIVLLYPVFLEERPTLVLPWLLLAAIRQLLCELTSLTLGLGTCLLLGAARPPCIKFVILKVMSIMPAFYMWMLVLSYYNDLKITLAFKTFTVGSTRTDPDYGLELAVRRKKTKSLLDEDQLRSKLVASLYGERNIINEKVAGSTKNYEQTNKLDSTDINSENIQADIEFVNPLSLSSKLTESTSCEDWFGNDINIPRNTDRILEQFVLMMLHIGIHLKREGIKPFMGHIFASRSDSDIIQRDHFPETSLGQNEADTSFLVASNSKYPASYLKEYPQIFMKKPTEAHLPLNSRSLIENATLTPNFENQNHTVTNPFNDIKPTYIGNDIDKKIVTSKKMPHANKESFRTNKATQEKKYKNKGNKQYDANSHNNKFPRENQFHLQSESSESINSIIQRMKRRLSESKKSFHKDKRK